MSGYLVQYPLVHLILDDWQFAFKVFRINFHKNYDNVKYWNLGLSVMNGMKSKRNAMD